jgi:uncharacterized protein YbjT (DUF2867 family)
MVGGLALRDSLRHPDVAQVIVIGRRRTGVSDPRLTEVLHRDFTDFRGIAEVFEGRDAALFCLGAYTGAVSDGMLREITVDYTIAFAEALRAGSPEAAFCLLSGQGADPSERSRMAFARYKGAAEKALLALGFPRVHVFRPGYIYPVEPRREPNLSYRIARTLYPLLRHIHRNLGIASNELARAMVHAALYGTGGHGSPVLENLDIRALARRIRG